jgi:dihydroorotase-like cyclic amidohydrolase
MAQIKEGIKASIMIVDIKSSYKIENKNSLYNGLEVFGVIKRVYANSTT